MIEDLMRVALMEARAAGDTGEVPVGAVVCAPGGGIVARAGNGAIGMSDPTAHAEILAIRRACGVAGNYRLAGYRLVCTVEPCVMCMGAAVHARIAEVVYGAPDLRWGGAGTLYGLHEDTRLNHRVAVVGGVLEEECRALLQEFFRARRG
ncbi:MAG: nucleoside deaminase [Desulfatibacillaceae bacterium]